MAIRELIEVCGKDSREYRKFILFFHTYTNNILHASSEDFDLAKAAAITLGRIIRCAGAIASRLLEEDVEYACNLTKRGKNDLQRLIAALERPNTAPAVAR